MSEPLNNDAAEKALIKAYTAAFNQKPNTVVMRIIELAVPRVAAGEQFSWISDRGFRQLKFTKND